jgi:hypothetical protein
VPLDIANKRGKKNMDYQLIDNSVLFAGQMKYVKGDIVPGSALSPELLKQYLRYKRLIPAQEAVVVSKPLTHSIKLSISVMAHPTREKYFPYLKKRLGGVPFSVDQKNCLLENSKASWRLYDRDVDFHVVIQDDSIVCDNFKERAIAFINEQEERRINERRPIQGYNFYFMKEKNETLKVENGCYMDNVTRGGVAICLPVKIIEAMLIEFDKQTSRHDDDRISAFMKKNGYKMCFPVPSLIDHKNEMKSLAGINETRKAWKFIDDMKVTIPKIIHQLWIGPKSAPLKWMYTWQDKNPEWEYRLWDEKAIMGTKWINQKHIDYYMSKGIWHGAKDVCQYEILYNHGGCFFDADAECLQHIDDLFLDEYDAWSYWENEKVRPGLIMPLLAATPGSKFAAELIGGLFQKSEVGEPWIDTGNKYVGEMYAKTKHNVKIYPSHYMSPEHFTGEKYTGFGKVYANHHFGTTLNIYNKGI